jgi:threonyl-tRNA synthetase
MQHKTHIELGNELGIYIMPEEVASGMPIFKKNGFIIREELINLMRIFNKQFNYEEVWTPHAFDIKLWKISGHLAKYKEKMFIFKTKEKKYVLKPMNCPGHCLIYRSEIRSYRDLPIRISEFGTVYRNEQSGEITGLVRVRSITQDDGHIFLREDQIEEEVTNILKTAIKIYEIFDMKDYKINLSTRPEKYIGSLTLWNKATEALKLCLDKLSLKYEIKEGEGAFYGPKIDIDVKDALNRYWQLTTIQLDFNLPRRFKLFYIDEKGKQAVPVMIHRAILGSLERFIGILLEHYQGKLPLWLAPEQIRILPISEKYIEYAKDISSKLHNYRVSVDTTNATLDKKILNAWKHKVPYIIIVGNKEQNTKTITVRDRNNNQKNNITIEEFIKILNEEYKKIVL